jgi:radical SAM protein with 4Fe4S-binding SPASM domain
VQSLIFEVTRRCNHACVHCYNFWHAPERAAVVKEPEPDTDATLKLLNTVLDQVDCPHVTLTGGEPLLRTDLSQIVELLHQRNVMTTLISNGRRLDEPTVVDLLDRGVSLFELPLLGGQREMHDALSGAPGAFDAVSRAMTHIRYHGGQFVVVFVATRRNLSHTYAVARLAFAFGARGLMFNRFNPGGRGKAQHKELLPSPAQLREALAAANRAVTEFNLPISCSIPIQPCLVDTKDFPNLGFGFCAAGTKRAYYTLDPWGNLRPCNHSATVLGNVLEVPVSELLAGDRGAAFVQAYPEFCESCILRAQCQGGCKAAAEVCYGSLTAQEPWLQENRPFARPILET